MHRTVRQYRALLAELPGNDTTDAFEASTMFLCTAARRRSGGSRSPFAELDGGGAAEPGVVTDFDSAAAAMRFRALLARCTRERARVEPVVRGIRYSFEVYRVRVAPDHRAETVDRLAAAWRESVATILDPHPLSPSSLRWRRRQDLAATAWRAVLLASPPVRTSRALRVRLPALELATVAVRSARLLGVTTHTRHGQGVCVVSVDDPAAALRFLARLAPLEAVAERSGSARRSSAELECEPA
jgi:hypothetical protein